MWTLRHARRPGVLPTPFLQREPASGGHRYSQIQSMTDTSATEFNTNCNLVTGKGCVMPPKGPGHFFPFFTLAQVSGRCAWEFGNINNGRSFGGFKQYGKLGPGSIGAFVEPIRPQPSC
jgi:hypothetical protein